MAKNDNFTTKIIAGDFKGKIIEIPNIFTTRSSKGILKESLFNTLQFEIVDKNFVEVFSGSGSIGLEALSRGASQCYFIEYNKVAYKVLQENIQRLDPSRCQHMLGDSFEKFNTLLSMVESRDEKTYFYFDPPFATRDGMDDVYEKTLALIAKINPSKCMMAVVEHMTQLDMPKEIGELVQVKRKKFGRSTMTYYAPKENI
ncbi:MAG: Methyltransferase [uncultured Sulfurovum sp.]|uniref:Methyltransferase n=1 Tax=uncultured Sulfurovum sp. TaxID=269237 RepID=A0A6S6T2E7_9BACT|nr:MAG: Methyltransferase [uncultured Sulfurovum sp.]